MIFELFQELHLQICTRQWMALIIPLPLVLLDLESVEKKGKNNKNCLDKVKNIFIVLEGLSYAEK